MGDPDANREHLLVFVTTTCLECTRAWCITDELASGAPLGSNGPWGGSLVIVTPSPSMEDERLVGRMSPPGAVVHMSSATWFDYGVLQAGTFLLARAAGPGAGPPWLEHGVVLGSGVPCTLEEVAHMLACWRAAAGAAAPEPMGPEP